MASSQLAPSPPKSRVDRESVERGVDALLKWMRARAKQRKAQLLEHDDLLYVVITLKRIPHRGRTNAYRIPLPYPLYDAATSSLCLIADDRPRSPLSPAAAKAKARELSLPISEVFGLSDLRSDYRPFEARRRLCDSHDLFFADRAIIPLLPRLLGKHFFKKKKIPVPIDLGRLSWPEHLRSCLASTLLYLRTGTCSGIKVGRVSQSREDIVENIMAAIQGAVERIPKKWANVRSLHVKSAESLALPIYQALPEMGLKIEALSSRKKDKQHLEKEMEEGHKKYTEEEGGSTKGEKKKKKIAKMGRIHEVLQYIGNDLDVSNDNDGDFDDGVEEDYYREDNEEGGGDEHLGMAYLVKKKKGNKGVKAIKEKEKKSFDGAAENGGVLEGEPGRLDLEEKEKGRRTKKEVKAKEWKKATDGGIDSCLKKRKVKSKNVEDKKAKKIRKSSV